MRTGVFGGSFDPIHLGHLLLAEQCLEQARLDRVLFIPAATPPHKQDRDRAPGEHRVMMIKLAIGGNDRFQLDTCELERSGISYTVDTLQDLRGRFPDDQLFLLMGADSLHEFSTWKDPDIICKLATPLVVSRPGSEAVDLNLLSPYNDEPAMQAIGELAFASIPIGISSTDLRNRIAGGKSIRYQTPSAVVEYIRDKRLYLRG